MKTSAEYTAKLIDIAVRIAVDRIAREQSDITKHAAEIDINVGWIRELKSVSSGKAVASQSKAANIEAAA